MHRFTDAIQNLRRQQEEAPLKPQPIKRTYMLSITFSGICLIHPLRIGLRASDESSIDCIKPSSNISQLVKEDGSEMLVAAVAFATSRPT